MILFNLLILYFCIMFISGLNTIIFRIKNKDFSADFKNCYCENCGHKLKFWESNLPIINYIILKGKCRYCNIKINKYHIKSELIYGYFIYLIIIIIYIKVI